MSECSNGKLPLLAKGGKAMAIAVWTETNMACPYCQKAIRRGKRRFGPGKVICANCQKELETGLIDIYEVSNFKKTLYILLDWFFPSYYRGIDQPGKLLIMLFHLFVAVSPIFSIQIAIFAFKEGQNPSDAFAGLPFLFMAFLHYLWLRRMVKETREFHYDGKLPAWKTPING